MSDTQYKPEGRTRLKAGCYTLLVAGPSGVILNLTMGMEQRDAMECHIDDDRLQELLVVSSVAAGVIEAQLHELQLKKGNL